MTSPGAPGGGPADSAGVPWGGRTLPYGGFEGDDGSRPSALEQALTSGDDRALVDALRGCRLLVPVAAVPTETGEGVDGLMADKETDMAVVLLDNPDGRTALPAFSSMADLAAFDASLRPVPVTAERAAEAAISEQAHLIVLDCSSEHAVEIRPSMLWALVQRQPWLPAHEDPFVADALDAVASEIDEVTGCSPAAGTEPGELVVELTLVPGLTQGQLQAVVQRVGERLANDGELRARIDALTFRVR